MDMSAIRSVQLGGKSMRRIAFLIAVILTALIVSVTFAQTTSGDLVGTVKDQSGALFRMRQSQ